MPGNEVGDRVHNFFAQDNLSQGLHNSQALDGNWPVLGDNLWPGSQRQVGLINTTTKNYNLQQSGSDRGQVGNPFHASHGLTFTQSSTRPEFAKSQSQSQPPNFNGFMYGNQFYETRQDETNFLAVDANSDRRNLTSRSLPTYGSQHVNGPENQGKSSVRSETSGPPVSFDFFGGQQQMNHQQFRILQSLQNQSSGLNDIQQLQQQVMLMKMQELQRQQQLRDARQQSLINQMPPVAKQASGSQPAALINGSVNSDALSYHWGNELGNANWLQRNPPAMQGSSNGLVFSPNQGQSQRMTDLVPQQVEQSLYGIPVSSSRGNLNQYPQMVTEKTSVQQQATLGNYLPGNHFTAFPSQVNMQDRSLIPRQRYQAENSFGHASSQALSTAIEIENVHQMNSMPRNAHMPEFGGSQEQLVPSENLQEKTETQDVASRDDVALDPTEERILFGSDDNIWAAFGKSPNMGGEGSNLFDGSGFNGFSSIQSGTWSALMQSAVAETSSSGTGLQEEMSGLNFQNNDIPSRNQLALSHNDGRKQQTPLTDDNLPMASSFASGTVPPSGDSNKKKKYQNVLGFQQFGRKFSYETAKRPQANPSQGLGQSSEDGGRRSNGVAVQKSGTEGSQMHGNASHSFDAESNASHLCNKPNDWNVFGSVTPYGDAGLTVQGSENLLQSNDQKQIMHREVVDSMWNSNSGRDLTIGLEQVKSALGSSQVNKEDFGLNNTAVLSGSGTMKAGEGSSQFLPNIYQLNSWKNADPLVQSKVGEVVGGPEHANNICSSKEEGIGLEMENSDKQENSNDSYRSNLSHHTSAGGQKENAVADAIDSRTFSAGKQKSSNQMGSKSMTSRKFHYHPMGNLDDGVEPPYGMKQPIYSQAMAHSVQPKLLGQVPKNSIEMGKGQSADLQRSNKGFDEAHCQGNFPGLNANISSPFNRSFDIGTQDKVSQSSQNMLELLHKVDQSREHAAMMHTIASESNAVSEMPQAENSDGSVGRLQRSQSSNSQGFGLQLGPPMQRLPIPNQSSSSQSSLQGISSLLSTNAASGIGQKGQVQLVPSSYVQAMPPSSERSLGENNRPGVVGQTDNEISSYRMPGNFSSAFNSGFPYSRGQLQSQDIAWSGGQLSRSLEKHASYSTQKDDPNNRPPATQSPETSFPDETGSIPRGNSVSSGSKQHSANILPGKVLALQFSAAKPVPVFQPSTVPANSLQGTSSKALPNVWSNVAAAQLLLGAQYQKVSSQFSQSNQTNLGNSTSAAYLNEGDQQGNFPSEFGASSANSQAFRSEEEQLTKECTGQQVSSQNIDLVQKMNETLTKVLTARTLSDGSPANSVSTQRDIEAFGRSLKPNNNLLQQNYSLLNQMQTMKNAEDDPSNRVLKRMRGPDSGLDGQLVPPTVGQSNDLTAIVGDALVPRKTLTSLDPTMLSFSAPENNMDRNFSSQHGNTTSQSVLAFSREGSQSSNSAALTKVDHSKISPQMAPSWFNQYGTLKNGQILPMYDAHKAAILKTGERPFTVGKSSSGLHTLNSMEPLSAAAVETYQFGSIKQSAIPSVAAEYLSSQILPSDASGEKHPVISRTKKRKSATSELDPWHKEVLQGSRNLQTISMAEVEWAKAANRHIDKVEEDVELMEDGSLMLKPKRRLILTTQLMQQLFRPPPAAILSLDANLDYESVAYSISRLALSDACGVVSLTNDKSHTLHDSINRHPDDCKTSENVDNELLLKVIDDFTAKARKLENEFLRLDTRASVLDLIVECQDLEKFSVINRFARFHGRGQADNAEAASSSDAAANTQKPYPQRYVTALPLPRNLPTRVQCCSL
ncbi:hypothetical protein ACH5RR_007780 [Cinchona calisaya]|uniref:Dentin sialophosphoprotein-like protein n=1 Tax=Cinchona calisaya TaxID=153742 RepID=A0ABD3ABA8_9GENT